MQPSRKPLSTQVFQGFESPTLRHQHPYGELGSSRFWRLRTQSKSCLFWCRIPSAIPSNGWV